MVTESSQSSEPGTGLLRAARSGNLDKVLEYLNTVDINTSNANGLNALHLASKDGHIAVVQELLSRGADVNAATKKGNTSLHIAALAGQEEVLVLLVEHGANVNVQSQNGFSPLYMASQENHDGVVKFLLSHGANQALATEDGFTPLAVAMQQGHDKIVSLLLSHDSRGKARLPALHIAAKKNDLSAAGLLLMSSPTPDLTSKSNFTPLHIASHYGNAQVATLLMDKGADVNFRAKHQITPLHVAAKWGKSGVAGLLIERGADVGGKTRDGLTPLHCAARSGHEQLVDLLVEKGAAIGAKTKNGLTPLHMSAQGDHVPSARILLFHKASVDDVTVDYLTPLHVAAHCGHVRVAKLLLDKKADPNSRALNGFTPLHIACKKNRIKVVELLLQSGASIEASTESGLTPLHVASFMGCMNIAIFLLQNGAEVEAKTVRGETPLHLAARANQTDIVRILLRNGASVDSKAKEEQTPLHISARLGNSDLVMLLLQHGANPDERTKEQLTAVHIAAKEGQEEVCSLLLDNGAAPAPATNRGFTPLHLASKNGHTGVAKLLIAKGAPVNAVGRNGLTPLHVATSHGHYQIATLLLDSGADSRAVTKNGHTPLHIAGKKNQIEIASKLVPNSDVNARSKAGFTPVHIAAMEGNLEFVKMLIGHGAETSAEAENHLTPLHLAAQEDRVGVADTLTSSGVQIDPKTAAGYTPLHIASHFGHSSMVKFLIQNGADIQAQTNYGNTPLHQAAQQGQAGTVSVLLEKGAEPDAFNAAAQTPLSIASKLNYVSVVESLRRVTKAESRIDKYKVVLPETMLEGLASDSEDECAEEPEAYRYLTVDDMKSLGDDSMPIDVEGALDDMEEMRTTGAASELSMSQAVGFLVSFIVDARGGAMRGCRHSGIRIVIPPGTAPAPTRVTCKYLRKERLAHPPPLMEGEALASRILDLGPVGVKFLGKVTIEVPHFAAMRDGEREVVVLRSEDGVAWREHISDPEGDQQQKELEANRLTRITTMDFPQYFALVSRIKQEVHAVGPEGGVVSSTVVKEVTAAFPAGALTKRIRVGIQAHPIPGSLLSKHGSRLSVSPIVTVEPRRRKFHKPITLSIPLPTTKDPNSSLRLLCSITGGSTRAQWEDVTGSTPLTFINDTVSFTTTVSARFWLIDSRQGTNELTRLATELYREAIVVPFMAKFLVYAKRIDPNEARLRVFCMTDDREEKTLEGLENFTEVAKSKDVEVLEGKPEYLEMAGNLNPVTKSGEQLRLKFYAFRENRLGLLVRLRDSNTGGVGRIVFRREPKSSQVSTADVPPTVILNISLPSDILPDEPLSQPPSQVSSPRLTMNNRYQGHGFKSALFGLGAQTGEIHKADLRLSDVANLLGDDWRRLAVELGVSGEDIGIIQHEYEESPYQQATVMLRLWMQQAGERATGNNLEKALNRIHREDIVEQCIGSLDKVTDLEEQIIAKTQLESSAEGKGRGRNVSYDEEDIMKDSESIEDVSQVEIAKDLNFPPQSPMTTSYETEEVKYGPEEKEIPPHPESFELDQEHYHHDQHDFEAEIIPVPAVKLLVSPENPVQILSENLSILESEIEESPRKNEEEIDSILSNLVEAEIENQEEVLSNDLHKEDKAIENEEEKPHVSEVEIENEEEKLYNFQVEIENQEKPHDSQIETEIEEKPYDSKVDIENEKKPHDVQIEIGNEKEKPHDSQIEKENKGKSYESQVEIVNEEENPHEFQIEVENKEEKPLDSQIELENKEKPYDSQGIENEEKVEPHDSDVPILTKIASLGSHIERTEKPDSPDSGSHKVTIGLKSNEKEVDKAGERIDQEIEPQEPSCENEKRIENASELGGEDESRKTEVESSKLYLGNVEDEDVVEEDMNEIEKERHGVRNSEELEKILEDDEELESPEEEELKRMNDERVGGDESEELNEGVVGNEAEGESERMSEGVAEESSGKEITKKLDKMEEVVEDERKSESNEVRERNHEDSGNEAEVKIEKNGVIEIEGASLVEPRQTKGENQSPAPSSDTDAGNRGHAFSQSRCKAAFDEDLSSRAESASPQILQDDDLDMRPFGDIRTPSIHEVQSLGEERTPSAQEMKLLEENQIHWDNEITSFADNPSPSTEDSGDEAAKAATSAAVQLIAEIEERVEERLQAASAHSSIGVTPTEEHTPKVSTGSMVSGIVGSTSVSFFTAREGSRSGPSEDRPKSSDSSTLAFISSSEYQTPGSLTESQSTLGEDEPSAFSKGVTCDIGTISSLPVTLTSSMAGRSAACAVTQQQESTYEAHVSGEAESDDDQEGNFQGLGHSSPLRHTLEDIEEELISSSPKGSLDISTDLPANDKFKRPASSSSSLNEFEKLESALLEEFGKTTAPEELLSEIEEGPESQVSEATEMAEEEVEWSDLVDQVEETEVHPRALEHPPNAL